LSPKKVEPDVTRLPETIIVPAKTALAELDPETKNVVSEPDNCGFVKTMLPDIPIMESLPYPEILLVIIGTDYLDSFYFIIRSLDAWFRTVGEVSKGLVKLWY
jgi:hypothetical protein